VLKSLHKKILFKFIARGNIFMSRCNLLPGLIISLSVLTYGEIFRFFKTCELVKIFYSFFNRRLLFYSIGREVTGESPKANLS
jgi:hypothetical protein